MKRGNGEHSPGAPGAAPGAPRRAPGPPAGGRFGRNSGGGRGRRMPAAGAQRANLGGFRRRWPSSPAIRKNARFGRPGGSCPPRGAARATFRLFPLRGPRGEKFPPAGGPGRPGGRKITPERGAPGNSRPGAKFPKKGRRGKKFRTSGGRGGSRLREFFRKIPAAAISAPIPALGGDFSTGGAHGGIDPDFRPPRRRKKGRKRPPKNQVGK